MPEKTEAGTLGGARSTAPAALITYIVGAFLTFGHVFNSNYVEPPKFADCSKMEKYEADWLACTNNNITAKYDHSAYDAAPPAFFAAIAWPIYWAGHYAIKVTK